jgi:hypothetical protein
MQEQLNSEKKFNIFQSQAQILLIPISFQKEEFFHYFHSKKDIIESKALLTHLFHLRFPL